MIEKSCRRNSVGLLVYYNLNINNNLFYSRNGRPTDNIAQAAQKMNVEMSGKHEEHASFIALFRTPKLRTRTIAILYNWFVCGLCFFGVSQYIGHVSGNIFTNVAISASILVTMSQIYYMHLTYTG